MRARYRGEQTARWFFRYPRRMQAMFRGFKRYGGFDHDEELAGSDGVHIHFWVPYGVARERVRAAASAAAVDRDVVSYGYGYIPGTIPVEVRSKFLDEEQRKELEDDGRRYA